MHQAELLSVMMHVWHALALLGENAELQQKNQKHAGHGQSTLHARDAYKSQRHRCAVPKRVFLAVCVTASGPKLSPSTGCSA